MEFSERTGIFRQALTRLHPALATQPPRYRVEVILWFNTGTLRNIASRNCPIESSPRNDRLGYIYFFLSGPRRGKGAGGSWSLCLPSYGTLIRDWVPLSGRVLINAQIA